MTTQQESTEKLRTEILTDAQKKGAEIVGRAMEDTERFLMNATSEADRLRKDLLDQARMEADRRRELVLATVPVETGRLGAARLEALLESVYADVRQKLASREVFDYRDTVITLAAHAISRMAGETFVLKVAEGDRKILGNSLAEDIERRVERSVTITIFYEKDTTGGGVLVEDGEARQVWDNRLLRRLDRLWPEMRRQVAARAFPATNTGDTGDEP